MTFIPLPRVYSWTEEAVWARAPSGNKKQSSINAFIFRIRVLVIAGLLAGRRGDRIAHRCRGGHRCSAIITFAFSDALATTRVVYVWFHEKSRHGSARGGAARPVPTSEAASWPHARQSHRGSRAARARQEGNRRRDTRGDRDAFVDGRRRRRRDRSHHRRPHRARAAQAAR